MTSAHHLLYVDPWDEEVGLHELQALARPPLERLPALRELFMGTDPTLAFEAALLLAAWGQDAAMQHLERVIEAGEQPSLLEFESANFGQYRSPLDEIAVAAHWFGINGNSERATRALRALLSLFEPAEFADGLSFALVRSDALELTPETVSACQRAAAAGRLEMASGLLAPLARWHGSDALPMIEPFVAANSSSQTKLKALQALRYVEADRARPCLERLSRDPSEEVRWAARALLRGSNGS
jgi:hypothetical protein